MDSSWRELTRLSAMTVRTVLEDPDELKALEDRVTCWAEENGVMVPCEKALMGISSARNFRIRLLQALPPHQECTKVILPDGTVEAVDEDTGAQRPDSPTQPNDKVQPPDSKPKLDGVTQASEELDEEVTLDENGES